MHEYHTMKTSEVMEAFNVEHQHGLTSTEIEKRQLQYGKNALPQEEGTSLLKLFLQQFADLMVIILLIAAGISLFLGETIDVLVIMAIVVLNALLGVYQEYRAEQAVAALSAMQVPLVRVRRAGKIMQISAEDLVPGDVILIEEGDRVPADGRLIESSNIQIDESALTGESLPVEKSINVLHDEKASLGDRSNMVYMGTSVTYGRGEMVVTDIGLETELGNIAAMLLRVEQGITPLQKRLNKLGQTLAAGAFAVVVVVFITGILRGVGVQEMFLTAIGLAVAAVPEGLPALVTIGLSLGAGRMIKRNALIRRLPAVETLGSVTAIYSDKTGTLTKNEMTVTLLALPGHDDVKVSGIGYTSDGAFYDTNNQLLELEDDNSVKRLLQAMALSTNVHLETVDDLGHLNVVGDTTEAALLVAAQKAGWTRDSLEHELPRIGELPFSSERKAMTTVHEINSEDERELFGNSQTIAITKGAPDRLIEWATHEHTVTGIRLLSEDRRRAYRNQVDKMASEGLRVLGIAYHALEEMPEELTPDIERDLIIVGLAGIVDPARPEAREAVRLAHEAGIRTIMITGDHALTARTVAYDLGILEKGQKVITGSQLDTMTDHEITNAINETSVFARVSPEHKLRLVQLMQDQNEVVAMTGDGVNDAPALKQADIGIAMGITGTDVSKGASAMILTDDNFASIVAAIEEGRVIYDNIRKFIKYLLSSNIGEILVMFVALLIGLNIPLTAIMILWINLVTDGLPAIALGFEPAEPDVMKRKPRHPDESVFADGVGVHIAWVGVLVAALTLGSFIYGYAAYGMDPLSPTLGLDFFSRVELVELLDDEMLVPADWDEISHAERTTILVDSGHNEGEHGGVADGILGAAQRIPRTIAFTVLALTQMFEVMAIHAGDRLSFFREGFRSNRLLMWAVLSTFVLQLMVIYVPFMQVALGTTAISIVDLLVAVVFGSIVLFAVEAEKHFLQGWRNKRAILSNNQPTSNVKIATHTSNQ